MAGDQRRGSSWPWRKLKGISCSSSAKAGTDKSTSRRSSAPLQLVSPTSSFKASTESARFLENMSQEEATPSAFVEVDGRLLEANALREQAEESLRALEQELRNVMREVMAKEALVKQHQKVADEAVSGWEKAEKEGLSLKKDLEGAAQQRVILEDRVAHLDGALKECMREVRHVRDEQEGKVQGAIACKTREWQQMEAELEAKQAELKRRLLESDAQNSAMVKSLQERARKILEANDAKSKAETELKVLQVKLGSSEKDISSLQYEVQLLSKELEIRNEEVAFCKKSADIAHKQHLDNVQKVTKLEADCQRLRSLLKKKLPGPAAIAQMRKEVEGLPQRESPSATAEFKRRPNRPGYASSTISFTNSHQRGIASSINRDADTLQGRLFSMEEENRLLKEALSKRIGELQTSWLLCAKTASKLSIAEDQLESLQGTPRGARLNGSEFTFATTREPSIASISDGYGGNEFEDEASCAESWASALIGELAHFRKEKITAQETIKEVTDQPYRPKESLCSLEEGSALHSKTEVVLDEEGCLKNMPLPKTKMQPAASEMGNVSACQDGQLQALSLLCRELDHKLSAVEEGLHAESDNEERSTMGNLTKESVISLFDAAHQKLTELEKAIQELGSGPNVEMPTPQNDSTMQEMDPMPSQPNSGQIVATAESRTSLCDRDESRQGATVETPTTSIAPTAAAEEARLQSAAPMLTSTSVSVEDGSTLSPLIAERDPNGNSVPEGEHESPSLSVVLCKLIALLEMLPGCATLDADCTAGKTAEQWEAEKEGLVACKEQILAGQSSVLEFLVRVGMVVGGAGELEGVLDSMRNADVAQTSEILMPRGLEGGGNEGNKVQADVAEEASELKRRLAEMEADVAEEVSELRRQLAEVETEKEKIAEEREELREEGAQLREEVARRKELQREVEARCEELQQKVQGFELQQDRSAVKAPHPGPPKESELVEAKEKLAECERTILMLGKQLHSLSSPQQPLAAHPPMPRHHPDRYCCPQYADVDESCSEIFVLDADVDHLPPRGRHMPCHVISGPQHFCRFAGPVHVAHAQQVKAPRQRYVDDSSWQQPEEEYSPPLSARSSPARSPARYMQQVPARPTNCVRTSLTQSLDAKTKPSTPLISRLFSRSNRHKS